MEILNTFLNGISLTDFIAFYMMGLLGFIISSYSHAFKKKLNFILYLKDTKSKLILNLIVIFCGIIFSENLLGVQLGLWGAFTAGLSTDVLIDRFITGEK